MASAPEMTSAPPPTMRAWRHTTPGSPSKVLTFSPAVTTPRLKSPIDVLVRITHASLNPAGSIMMQLCPSTLRAKPIIPELDFAGTIVEVGAEVGAGRELAPGVAVFGSVPVGPHVRAGVGSLAEYVVVAAGQVVRKPDEVSLEGAAGLGVAGCTALVLVERAELERGDRVLINGASGGVGSMVVQLVRQVVGETGRVVAICSGANVEMVKKLGADEVIDHIGNAPIHQHLTTEYSKTPFDIIIDAYGVQDLFTHCSSYLASGKPYVTVGIAFAEYSVSSMLYACSCMLHNMLWPRLLGGVNRPYGQITATVSLTGLQKLAELVEDGKLDVVIDSCWPMEDILKAYKKMLSRRARGKIIVIIKDT